MSSRNREAYEKLLAVIQQVVTQKNLQKPLSLYLGKRQRYFTNLFSAKNNIALSQLFDIAEYCKVPAAWFVAKAVPQPSLLPEDQLLFESEPGCLPANLFLDDLLARLEAVQHLAVEKKDGLACNRPVLDDLEEERFVNRHSALAKTEELAEQLMRELFAARPEPLPARRLGELAATLGLWATIQRAQGFRNLAVKALIAALPLARRSGYSWALASCLQRAGYVIHTLGRPDLACGLLDEAMWRFVEAEATTDIRRLFVDRGAFLSAIPTRRTESTEAYRHALEILPDSDWRNRASALQGLAYNLHMEGHTTQALQHARDGKAVCIGESYILGCLRWREGAILFDMEQFGQAKSAIRDALHLMGQFSSAGDIALVALDYAEALIRAEDFQEANLLIEEVTRWLPELRSNPLLHRALSRFLDLARIGEFQLAEIAHTRQSIGASQSSKQDSTLAIR